MMTAENERLTVGRTRTNTHTTETVGDRHLCAWATSGTSCRVQTTDPNVAKKLAKLPDCERVGYSVCGPWIRVFALPYTLDWVRKNVVEKLTLDFPRKSEGHFSENARHGLCLPQVGSSAGRRP